MTHHTTALPIVILLSGHGSNCQAIINAVQAGLPAKIVAVVSDNPEAYGLTRAKQAGIATTVVNPKEYADKQTFNAALLKTLNQYAPQLLVLAGYMRILDPSIVKHYQQRIINIHPSLLPKHPGLNTHQRVLDAKDISHGVSVHLVTEDLDAGPLLAQAAFKVHPEDCAERLQHRAHELEHVMYPQVIHRIARHWRKLIT